MRVVDPSIYIVCRYHPKKTRLFLGGEEMIGGIGFIDGPKSVT